MRWVLSFGFNDTWLIIIWLYFFFSVITSVITVWHMVSFTEVTLKTTHSTTVCSSFVSRQQWSSWAVVKLWCVVFTLTLKKLSGWAPRWGHRRRYLKSECVSGNQTEVWEHSHCWPVASKDRGQSWVSYPTDLSLGFPPFSFGYFMQYFMI